MGVQQNMADIMRVIKQRENLSMTEFSEELGISYSTLQEYLNAQGNPTILMVEHIAHKLKLSPTALISGVFEPNQIEILLLLLESIQEFSHLPQHQKRQFAELLQQMIQLWEGLETRPTDCSSS